MIEIMTCNWVPRLCVTQGKNPDTTVGNLKLETEIQSAPQIVRNLQNPLS